MPAVTTILILAYHCFVPSGVGLIFCPFFHEKIILRIYLRKGQKQFPCDLESLFFLNLYVNFEILISKMSKSEPIIYVS